MRTYTVRWSCVERIWGNCLAEGIVGEYDSFWGAVRTALILAWKDRNRPNKYCYRVTNK